MKQTVSLPWPAKELSPNARTHWAAKARAVKGYRLACAWHAAEQKIRKMKAPISATITFHPPSRRRMDIDNMLARAKAGIDAVSDAIGVDDSRWEFTLIRGDIRPPLGAIFVEISSND